jgi:hypothetical protein
MAVIKNIMAVKPNPYASEKVELPFSTCKFG